LLLKGVNLPKRVRKVSPTATNGIYSQNETELLPKEQTFFIGNQVVIGAIFARHVKYGLVLFTPFKGIKYLYKAKK